MVALVVILGGISVLIAIQFQSTSVPSDEFVTGSCPGAQNCSASCSNGSTFSDSCPAGGAFSSCQQWCNEACNTVGSTPVSCGGGTGDGGGGGGSTNDCTGKSCGDGTCFTGDNPNDGGWGCNCNNGTVLGPSTNPGTCSTGNGGGGDSCAGPLESCESTGCCSGLVCQGTSGNLRCEDPGDEDPCPGGGTCTGYISFSCTQLTNGQCLENPVDGNDPSHAGGCGQIDQVCIGGDRNRQLCGDFTIFDSTCGTTNPPPPPPPQPSVSACGGSCTDDNDCTSGHVCDGSTCKLPTCTTPGNCSDDACEPVACGDGNADAGEECGETGLSCGNGETCIVESCICQTTSCGDDCSNSAECPNDHTCSNGTCTLDACIDNPSSCSEDGCTHIPVTALISDDVDRVLIALVAVILGAAVFFTRIIDRTAFSIGGMFGLLATEYKYLSDQKVPISEVNKRKKYQNDRFEDRFED